MKTSSISYKAFTALVILKILNSVIKPLSKQELQVFFLTIYDVLDFKIDHLNVAELKSHGCYLVNFDLILIKDEGMRSMVTLFHEMCHRTDVKYGLHTNHALISCFAFILFEVLNYLAFKEL